MRAIVAEKWRGERALLHALADDCALVDPDRAVTYAANSEYSNVKITGPRDRYRHTRAGGAAQQSVSS